MNRVLFILMVSVSLWSSGYCAPQNIVEPKIILNHIETVEEHELSGDELYIDVETMLPNRDRKFTRIPKRPHAWSSKQIDRVKKVTVWSRPIESGKSVI